MTYHYATWTLLSKILLKITIAIGICTVLCVEARAQAVADSLAAPAALGKSALERPPTTDPQPLQVGDTIPDWLWHLPLPHWNGPTTDATLTLSDYSDRKLVLLDFWASFCTTCLNGFPLLDSLQRVHPQDLQVILVNSTPSRDTPDRIVQAIARRLRIPLHLPIAFPDTKLYKHFEITGIPRYIWIDRSRVIRAITRKSDVTATTIETFIANH